jgi:DNA-binding response OmpR family regulator
VSEDLPLKGRQVLVVEDQYLLARDVSEWLEEAGAKVFGPVPDIERACQLIDREKLDGAVLDINLGRGATYEVAERLSERSVPFLFATGYDQTAIPEEFQWAPRLEKPFKGPELVLAIQGLQLPHS